MDCYGSDLDRRLEKLHRRLVQRQNACFTRKMSGVRFPYRLLFGGLKMYIDDTQISCGICQLSNIGNNPKQIDMDGCIEDARSDCYGIMLASLADNQGKRPVTFLKKNGFRQVGKWKKNPNSGNRIALFMKRLRPKKNKDYESY